MKKLLLIGLLVALAGCATINSLSNTTTVAINTTVEFAAAKYISEAGSTAALQLARAKKVKAIAVEIQGIDTGSVTIAQLEATVAADIAKLSPDEQILATALMNLVITNLNVQVTTGVIATTVKAEINQVMADVIAAASLYGA
jgi:uncharacterized protein YceK